LYSSAIRPDPADEIVAAARRLCAPPLSPRAVSELGVALDPLRRSAWPQVAWRASRLTSGGFPVEFAFSANDDLLRITLEPGGPECDAADKLDLALASMRRMDQMLPPAGLVDTWREAQKGVSLRWGCWLGLRQDADSLRAKLYIEATDGWAQDDRASSPLGGRLRMIGHEPRTRRTEFYHVLPRIAPRQLELYLERCGIAHPAPLLDTARSCLGMPLDSALKWTQLGLSRTIRDGAVLPGAGLFFRANAMSTPHVRKAMSARAKPFDLEMVSLTANLDGRIEIRAGVSGDAVLSAPRS
jgi:hypothetical protein